MKYQKPSDSELKILNILSASEKALSVAEIIELLKKDEIQWAYRTVSTFLNRLEKKGLVTYRKEGITFYYYPTIEECDIRKFEAKKFLTNYFKGSLKSFLSAFADEELTDEELKDIKDWAEHLDGK